VPIDAKNTTDSCLKYF